MANCPKCNAKLRLIDWRPECPKCGVNMVYYGMEDRLLADAEKAEAEHAKFQKGLDRFKASSIGGARQIIRLILAIVPVAGLFLPLAKLTLENIPYYSDGAANFNIDILKIVDFFMNYFDFNAILAAIKSPVVGKPFIFFAAAIVLFALSVVMGILNFGRCFCSSKKSSCVKNIVVSALSVVCIVLSGVMFGQFASGINAIFPDFISGAMGFGVFVTAALHLPVIVLNALLVKNPIVVKYTELPDYSKQAEEAEAAEQAVAAE
ncbi:MAG: hypothetical protein IJ261_03960 [Clostridia bacterium]|nr:hypothetical protein [Clostridia bacterium]